MAAQLVLDRFHHTPGFECSRAFFFVLVYVAVGTIGQAVLSSKRWQGRIGKCFLVKEETLGEKLERVCVMRCWRSAAEGRSYPSHPTPPPPLPYLHNGEFCYALMLFFGGGGGCCTPYMRALTVPLCQGEQRRLSRR